MKCPYCLEEIQDGALKCKHCGSMLGQDNAAVPVPPQGVQVHGQAAGVGGFHTINADLMRMARESLGGKWGVAIGAYLVVLLIVVVLGFIPFVGPIVNFLFSGPFALGFAILYLSISRVQDTAFDMVFKGFNRFGTAFGAYFFTSLFVFLWMLLLIIPGIIAAYSYAMTYYIIADNDSIGSLEAISKSKEMMRGYKWKLFCMHCRFIGWALLCLLTLGIGFLWLIPYISVSQTKFYDDIK